MLLLTCCFNAVESVVQSLLYSDFVLFYNCVFSVSCPRTRDVNDLIASSGTAKKMCAVPVK